MEKENLLSELTGTFSEVDDKGEAVKLPKILLLTDDIIAQYSEDHVLTEYRDINFQIKTKRAPYKNGVYDQDIFGSLFSDRCNCGSVRTPGLRCPRCGSMVLDEVQSFKRFARIECPVFYSTRYKFKKLLIFLTENFKIVRDIQSPYLDNPEDNRNEKLNKVYDICQWEYNKEDGSLKLTDNITDFTKCSFEGLLNILAEHYPEKLKEARAYINQYILVPPMVVRAPIITFTDGKPELRNNRLSTIYMNIIYCIHQYYATVFPTMKTESGKAIFRGSLRRLIASSVESLSQLFNTSKENLARTMQGTRIPNSGRAEIVPDPNLTADEVIIPRHLMYEMCREEFIKFISTKKQVSLMEAELLYKSQAELKEIQDLFNEYINGDGTPGSEKLVMINRQPSLHDLGMFCCKVKLTEDYTMKIPMVLCEPLNGDFDGDQVAMYAIPKEMNSTMEEALSAKHRFYYRKNHVPIYRPLGDMMHGLTLATKIDPQSKPEIFDSLDDLKKYKRETKGFKYQTEVVLNGRKTTLGREILSDYFQLDINSYLLNLDKSYNHDFVDAKNMIGLYAQLGNKEDNLERIKDIQNFCLKISTLSGATSVKISDLYLGIDKDYLNEIKKFENDDSIDPKTKELKIREIYDEFEKVELNRIPEGLKRIIDESGRAKSTELRDMAVQRLNVSPDHKFHISDTTLAEGMSPEDYIWHAIENRATQDIKGGSVPQSGYLTRQFIYLASEYNFKDGDDKNNSGINIVESDAEGRTKLDGTIVKKSDSNEIIKVRSIVTSTLKRGIITKDMLSDIINYKSGSRVGMSLITSVTEQLTQKGLALKHGGSLYNLDIDESSNKDIKKDNGCFRAQENGTVELTDDFILFHGETKEYKYPKCDNYTPTYSANGQYKKGEVFGVCYREVTPAYKLDSVIKLCQAKSTTSRKKFSNNSKLVSECYAAKSGVIHYQLIDGEMTVSIDDDQYWYNSESVYKYPDGTKVNKYDRICSGTLDLNSLTYRITDYVDLYYFFRIQFKELMGNDLADELIEFIYVLLSNKTEDGVEIKSVTQNIYGSESFYKTLAFGYSSKSFGKIGYEGMDFISDPITSVMLSLITNNTIQ